MTIVKLLQRSPLKSAVCGHPIHKFVYSPAMEETDSQTGDSHIQQSRARTYTLQKAGLIDSRQPRGYGMYVIKRFVGGTLSLM